MREVFSGLFSDVRVGWCWRGANGTLNSAIWRPWRRSRWSFPPAWPGSLGELAERLTAEALVAERALLDRPECLKMLGIAQQPSAGARHGARADSRRCPGDPLRLPSDPARLADLRSQRRRARRLHRVVALSPPHGRALPRDTTGGRPCARRSPTPSSPPAEARAMSACSPRRATWRTSRSLRSWQGSSAGGAARRSAPIPGRSSGTRVSLC